MSTMNPFKIKPEKIESSFRDWKQLYSKAYDKYTTDPYTKVRIILANGTEFEANAFGHNFARHCVNNDLRRELALVRRVEQQQQKAIASLKPIDENLLEHTIAYEQLAVDLTAIMAQNEKDKNVKKALDFALLEDFDHLYRFSDLLEMESGVLGEKLVGEYTEIMPGRPTICEHRHPFDDVRRCICNTNATPITKLNASIITAAEQQTMNYYMNIGIFHPTDLGRKLYAEVAMIEEQHVTQYESLNDSSATWLEMALLHEYAECYLYYSAFEEETDEKVKGLWERHFYDEVSHLHHAVELLKKYEKKAPEEVIPDGNFPELLKLKENLEYVRTVLAKTVGYTADGEGYAEVNKLDDKHQYFKYNKKVNSSPEKERGHTIILDHQNKFQKDYRYQLKEHPIKSLRSRTEDNFDLGRIKTN
jgi:hypothetical protein